MRLPLPQVDGYEFTEGAIADVAELTELIHAVQRRSNRGSLSSPDIVATHVSEPTARQAAVRSTDAGALAGYAFYDHVDPHVQSHLSVWVHPDSMGRGIGSALTSWAISQANVDALLAPPGSRVTIVSSPRDGGEPAVALLEGYGYAVSRYFLEMSIELAANFAPPEIPAGVTIRNITDNDGIEVIADTQHDAFRDHYGWVDTPPDSRYAEWSHWRSSEVWDNELGWLADVDGEAVALQTALDRYGTLDDTGYVAVLGVRRDWRGRGIARALLETSFAEFSRRGKKTVVLHVDADNIAGATRLYRRVGMHETERNPSYELEIRPGDDILVR